MNEPKNEDGWTIVDDPRHTPAPDAPAPGKHREYENTDDGFRWRDVPNTVNPGAPTNAPFPGGG